MRDHSGTQTKKKKKKNISFHGCFLNQVKVLNYLEIYKHSKIHVLILKRS